MSAPTTTGPLPFPENFPYEWPDPAMAAEHWTWDAMHQPHPLTPLAATLEFPAFAEGTSRGFQALKIPGRFHTLWVNGYGYQRMEMMEGADSFPPPWWASVEAEFIARVPVLTQTWENEYLPQVQAFNNALRTFDYDSASIDELLAFLREAREGRIHMWDLHMQAVIPIIGAASQFGDMCENLLGAGGKNESLLMLQGFENLTVESGKALWKVARSAAATPAVAKLFETAPVDDLSDALRKTGPSFWAEFAAYLERYGWRSDAFELADPAWAEDPRVPLTQVRDLIHAPDRADPARTEARCAEERDETIASARERLDGNVGAPLFEMMLGAAQQYVPIQENHNFYIDQMNTVLMRQPILAIGQRLAEMGAIAQRDDVFFLTYDELFEAARAPQARDWRSMVDRRRTEREHWSTIVPPREIGTPPPEGVPANPMMDAFFGTEVEQSKDPKVLNGHGASGGTVTATARVVTTLDQAGKLEPGDVLVCRMTLPAWTPLFASVSAVVADSGGVLSHCAIVAREYRIPCVVGTQVGTEKIKDGQRVTVDGTQGIVRIEA